VWPLDSSPPPPFLAGERALAQELRGIGLTQVWRDGAGHAVCRVHSPPVQPRAQPCVAAPVTPFLTQPPSPPWAELCLRVHGQDGFLRTAPAPRLIRIMGGALRATHPRTAPPRQSDIPEWKKAAMGKAISYGMQVGHAWGGCVCAHLTRACAA
jgi:hypothetical protein